MRNGTIVWATSDTLYVLDAQGYIHSCKYGEVFAEQPGLVIEEKEVL